MSSSLVPTATRVSYHQASTAQLALALADATLVLAEHFPTLDFAAWSTQLQQLQPDLWVEGAQHAYFDAEDLARLTQRLATTPGLPQLSPVIYCDEAVYLARHLVHRQNEALRALAEIEVNPTAYGGIVCGLIFSLATGNGVAHEVYRRTQRTTATQHDPALACQAAPARIDAVRRARGERAALLCTADVPPAPPAGTNSPV